MSYPDLLSWDASPESSSGDGLQNTTSTETTISFELVSIFIIVLPVGLLTFYFLYYCISNELKRYRESKQIANSFQDDNLFYSDDDCLPLRDIPLLQRVIESNSPIHREHEDLPLIVIKHDSETELAQVTEVKPTTAQKNENLPETTEPDLCMEQDYQDFNPIYGSHESEEEGL